MISTGEVIDELIKGTPYLEEALAQDIINYSSLARRLRPKIEKKLFKSVQTGAIIMALKRSSKKLKGTTPKSDDILKSLGDIIIRSNLVDYTYVNSPTLGNAQKRIFEKTSGRKDIFITVSNGVGQSTVIASESIGEDIKKLFRDEKTICTIPNLASLTIKITEEATHIPGVLYSVLKVLAWEGINIIECVSTYTELTVILDKKDIERAFSAIKNFSEKTN